MRALMYKDFTILKKWILLVVVISLVIGFLVSLDASLALITPLILAFIAFSTLPLSFNFDDKSDFLKFAISSPISRKDYVLSKYVPSLIIGTIGGIIGSIAIYFKHSDLDITFIAMFFSFAAPLLVAALLLPFIIKYGTEKGRITMVVAYMIVFALLNQMKSLSTEIISVLGKINFSVLQFSILFFVIAMVLYIISIKISVIIMNRKEI